MIPSKEQFSELVSNCDIELITKNGVNGYCLKSRHNGMVLFFPVEGEYSTFHASYWTSDYSKYNNDYAYTFFIEMRSWGAECGFYEVIKGGQRPVRAVTIIRE